MSSFLTLVLTLAVAGAPDVRKVSPFVGDEVAIVAHLDLTRLDPGTLGPLLLSGSVDDEEAAEWSAKAARWVDSLRQAGAKDVYILVGSRDLPGPPSVVVPLEPGADAKAIGRVLCGTGEEKPPYAWPTCATIHDAVFAGTTAALERARRPASAPRPELADAFGAAGEGPARVVLIPSADQRRVLKEIVPTFPRELGGGPTSAFTGGMLWTSIAIEDGAKPALRVVIRSRDAESSQSLVKVGKDAVKSAKGRVPMLDLSKVDTKVVADRIEIRLGLAQAASLVSIPFRAAMETTDRSKCVQQMKEIGLAFHNYHSAHESFPPAASRDKNGRPLLSWRVHLLPFLDQQSLFNEFRLDEPWDGPHNKALIARMPDVYACPAEARKLRREGKTTYLVPRGKATISTGGDGIKLKEITDGTSNTILVVDASDARAVIWTKPDDWEVDLDWKKASLFGHHAGGTNFTFADGGIRFLKSTITDATLRGLLTRNGGEVAKDGEY